MRCYFNGSGVMLGVCTKWNVEVTMFVFVTLIIKRLFLSDIKHIAVVKICRQSDILAEWIVVGRSMKGYLFLARCPEAEYMWWEKWWLGRWHSNYMFHLIFQLRWTVFESTCQASSGNNISLPLVYRINKSTEVRWSNWIVLFPLAAFDGLE